MSLNRTFSQNGTLSLNGTLDLNGAFNQKSTFNQKKSLLLALSFTLMTVSMLFLSGRVFAGHELKHIDPELSTMGRLIFSDARFSKTGQTACTSCHKPEYSFSDNQALSTKDDGTRAILATPALFNLDRKFGYFSRKTIFSLERAVQRCMTNQMDSSVVDVYVALKKDKTLSNLSYDNFGRISAGAVYKSLTNYLFSLQAQPSRYELYLDGDLQALTQTEQRGMVLFEKKGCSFCHNGKDMGGAAFADAVNENYLEPVLVPRLRNLNYTAPYFSDGSSKTLKQAITRMYKMHNKSVLSQDELELIALFLLSHSSSIHDFEGPVRHGNVR